MNKVELNKYIESICKQIPVVHSFYTDDVYEVWAVDDIQYGSVSFVVTNSSISDNVTNWTGMIYYADRLLEDKSNRDSVQTDANNVINAVMNAIAMDDDIITINYPTEVTFFEQRFADLLAGGYANIQIGTDNSISKCGYGFVKEQEGCASKIAELEDEIEVLEEKNDRLSNLLDTTNEALDEAQNNLTECRTSNETLIESNQQLETENDRLESEVGRLESEVDDLNRQLNESILPNYESIGYNLETADPFYQCEYDAIERAKSGNLLEQGSTSFNGRESTVLYFPTDWDEPNNPSLNFNENRYIRIIPDCPTMRNNDIGVSSYNTFGNCYNLIYVGRMKTNRTSIDLDNAFSNCFQLRKTPIFDFPSGSTVSKIKSLLSSCYSIKDISTLSDLNISNVTDMQSTFSNCKSLTDLTPIANWDTSSVTNMRSTFSNCKSLTDLTPIANWDTSSVTNMENTFYYCTSLTDLTPLANWDTSKVTSFGDTASYSYNGIFAYCTSLTDLSGLQNWDTSSATNMRVMFYSCRSLSILDGLTNWDTSSATNMGYLFYNCPSLADITPLANWDVSNVTDLKYMFGYCYSLTDLTPIANWVTSKVTDMTGLLYYSGNIQKIPLLDCSSVTTISSFFGYTDAKLLTDLGGFAGLKVNFDGLQRCPNLTVQSLLNVFNTIADVNGLGTRTLTIGSTNLNKLTDDQKAIATAKGWTLK